MYVYRSPYEQSRLAAQQEIESLTRERAELETRIKQIDQRLQQLSEYMRVIAPLMEEDPGSGADAGLTNLCREVLERTNLWMSAQTVRNQLGQIGIDISGYTNPMAVLHSTLKRIAQTKRGSDGNTYYGASGLSQDAPILESNSAARHHPVLLPVEPVGDAKCQPGMGPVERRHLAKLAAEAKKMKM